MVGGGGSVGSGGAGGVVVAIAVVAGEAEVPATSSAPDMQAPASASVATRRAVFRVFSIIGGMIDGQRYPGATRPVSGAASEPLVDSRTT